MIALKTMAARAGPTKANRGRFQDLPFLIKSRGVRGAADHDLGADVAAFGSAAYIECESCPSHTEKNIAGKVNREMIQKDFERAGWECISAANVRWRCPACIESRKRTAKGESPKAPVMAGPPPPEVPRRVLRDVARALETCYDFDRREYLLGWTDTRLGEAFGVAADVVKRVRQMTPAQLAEQDSFDAEMTDVRSQLDRIKADIEAILNRCGDLDTQARDADGRLDLLTARYKVVRP